MDKLTIVFRQPPHGTATGREALDLTLLAASYDIPTEVVFVDDGVYQLLKEQRPAAVESKDYIATFRALPLYEVDEVYLCRESLAERGIETDQLILPVTLLGREELAVRLHSSPKVLTF